MIKVAFTYALKRFFPGLRTMEVAGETLPEILDAVEKKHPGMKGYILDDQGRLREHVNIFVDGQLVEDRKGLTDDIDMVKEVYIMQALSGG